MEEFQKEIEANPSSQDAYLRAGVIELERDRLPEAEEMLRRAVALDSGNALAHFELGRSLLKARKFEAAQDELHQALRLNPRLIRAHYGLAQALGAVGKTAEAQRELQVYAQLLARNRSLGSGASASNDSR